MIVDRTGSFDSALVLAAVMAVGGAVSYLLGVTATIEVAELLGKPVEGLAAD